MRDCQHAGWDDVTVTWRTAIWLPAPAIARHYGVKTSTVYKWASQYRWPHRGHYHARLYDLWDAQDLHDYREQRDRAHA